MNSKLFLLVILGYCAIAGGMETRGAIAQVTPDGTTNTTVDANDNNFTIEDGDRAGGNLFHSFQDFSVPNGGSAVFNNADAIQNIFSRVTGGNISNIDGLIRANGSANLFLINPAGIIFGRDARLDIGGSFYGSTADSILFPDGIEFSATDTQQPVLTVNAPIGLNFRNNPGDIIVRGDGQGTRSTTELIDTEDALRVDSDETLALLGGNLNFEGATIKTAGGKIELGSVDSNEQVNLTSTSGSLSVNYEETQNFRDIQLSQTATVDASGEGGGDIRIQGRNITLTDGSTIEASTIGSLPGGNLDVTATDSIEIIGRSGVFTGFFSQVYTGANGNAGNVTINANNILNVENGSQISAETFGEGNAGNVTINADNIIVTNNLSATLGSQISSSTFGEGNAGNVTLNADNISFDGVSSEGFPSGAFSAVVADAEGNGGNVNVTTNRLSLTNGGEISSSTFGEGNAGNVTINANNISFDGISTEGSPSGAFSSVQDDAEGDGGNVNVTANRLSLTNGGQVSVLTFGEGNGGNLNLTVSDSITISDITETTASGLFASAILGSGNGGSITVSTDNLTVQNQGAIRASNFQTNNRFPPGTGNTGSIDIEARSVELNSLGNISADSASGNGGNVSIRADSLTLDDRASISVSNQAGVGRGGNINLSFNETLLMSNNSTISAQAIGNASGGNIEINAPDGVIVASPDQNNDIIANAEVGDGGNINITAESLLGIEERPLNSQTNDINASSDFGLDGNISINVFDVDPLRGAAELPTNVIEPQQTIVQACANDSESVAQSGLTIQGRGGVPPEPTGPLDSDIIITNEETTPNSQSQHPEIQPIKTQYGDIVPARGVVKTKDGRVILTAYPTDNIDRRTPNISGSCS